MHSTRIATFLLGAWMACCVMIDAMQFVNPRLMRPLFSAPQPGAGDLIKAAGPERAQLLLRHFAMEQNRFYLADWATYQIVIGVAFLILLFFAVDHKIVPLALAIGMVALVLFQDFAVIPELVFRGRAVDFPPGSLEVGAQARVMALTEIFAGAEAAKFTLGTLLAVYIFLYKSRRRVRATADPAEIVPPPALRRA